MAMSRKQHKALERHKAIVKARNIRNNNLRYNAIRSSATWWARNVFMRWSI